MCFKLIQKSYNVNEKENRRACLCCADYVCNAIPVICYAFQLIGIGLIFNLDQKKTDEMYDALAKVRKVQDK